MSTLKIFSYLPNPRVWKAQIAAAYCGVDVEVVGDKPKQLAGWLWDVDARPLSEDERTADNPNARTGRRGFNGTLYKTDAFLQAHPFGTVPAAFSPNGTCGIFESNSILRAVARVADDHDLYGANGYEASRIDSFLDAGLVFAREAQVYLLNIDDMRADTYDRMAAAHSFYVDGIEAALENTPYLAGESLTIADIAFVCDLGQFLRERTYSETLGRQGYGLIGEAIGETHPNVLHHLVELGHQPQFAAHLGSFLTGLG